MIGFVRDFLFRWLTRPATRMVFGAILFVFTCAAQQLLIHGTVRDRRGAIPDAMVTLRGASGGARLIVTGSDGKYEFGGLDIGVYTITFERPGYVTATRRVSLTFDEDSGEMDVKLEKTASRGKGE
jgi:hypothetical protein